MLRDPRCCVVKADLATYLSWSGTGQASRLADVDSSRLFFHRFPAKSHLVSHIRGPQSAVSVKDQRGCHQDARSCRRTTGSQCGKGAGPRRFTFYELFLVVTRSRVGGARAISAGFSVLILS
ncbi:hypothetical protein PoB_002577100 [Plakobranchus ocellatus]|uniref:Uncharacterized protein n=1 Tax=Plakobranchus ocellatus TaxID=259542 RepID=A0AAV3ZXJ3_9GAST|nr:hypothetical protein PoB_002577100 [Plakobranchus ocellatus]